MTGRNDSRNRAQFNQDKRNPLNRGRWQDPVNEIIQRPLKKLPEPMHHTMAQPHQKNSQLPPPTKGVQEIHTEININKRKRTTQANGTKNKRVGEQPTLTNNRDRETPHQGWNGQTVPETPRENTEIDISFQFLQSHASTLMGPESPSPAPKRARQTLMESESP